MLYVGSRGSPDLGIAEQAQRQLPAPGPLQAAQGGGGGEPPEKGAERGEYICIYIHKYICIYMIRVYICICVCIHT